MKNLFRLRFVDEKSNVIFLGGVGLGKTHLATALGYHACLQGHTVLFCSAVDAINNLAAAQSAGRLKQELKKYHKPALVILDELGYLPIDKIGADLLFQIISHRYEQGSLIITTNRAFKDWPEIFNNDSEAYFTGVTGALEMIFFVGRCVFSFIRPLMGDPIS